MKPVFFKQQNVVVGKDQEEYLDLPAYVDKESPGREVISCWQLSFMERLKVLITGKIWNRQFTFGTAYSPTALQIESPWSYEAKFKAANKEEKS